MPYPAATPPLLEVTGLSKRYPGVQALDNVSLTLSEGEVLAVIGENGAGKSTLMKILAGIEQADGGAIRIQGEPVLLDSVNAATRIGIALIHQELNLAGNLDAAGNMYLGREPRRFGVIDRRRLQSDARSVLDRLGVDISPNELVGRMSIGRQQLVEIAKALSIHARILIMDEPTSSLSQQETGQLYRVVRDLKGDGVSVIFISHRLGEVHELADRVVVLRDGRNAGELPRAEISHDSMVRMMVGRDVEQARRREPLPPGKTMLLVQDLVTDAHPAHALSFSISAGEVVGLAGLVGAGRTELLETLFGIREKQGGSIEISGQSVDIRSPVDAIHTGIGLVPEDRKQHGLILEMIVRENISLARVRDDQRAGFLNGAAERTTCRQMIGKLEVRTTSDRKVVRLLSGGNQQKVVWAKWLATQPRVLLLDEPTRGIDVGAKRDLYLLMEELAENGMAILFASSEMEEILTLSDRVLVMHEGRIAGELRHRDLSEEAVMRLATGTAAA